MAYTEDFDVNAPADSDDASDGDDSIRQLKRSIIERMLTFFTDWDANPLVPISQAKILTGTLTLTATQASIPSLKTKEFDVTVEDAVVGSLAVADYDIDADTPYPTAGGTPPDTSGTDLNGRDLISFKAWCVDAGKVRVRMTNTSSLPIGGVDDTVIRASVIQA